jgi:hypothetical protein
MPKRTRKNDDADYEPPLKLSKSIAVATPRKQIQHKLANRKRNTKIKYDNKQCARRYADAVDNDLRKAQRRESGRRRRQQQVHEPEVAFRKLRELQYMHTSWQAYCNSIIKNFQACAFCGKIVFGGKHAWHASAFSKIQPAPDSDAPILLYNPFLQDHVSTHDGLWWCCGSCKDRESREKKMYYNVKMWPSYLRNLLSLQPEQPLLLSVIKCGLRFTQRICGFLCINSFTQAPYLLGPLVKWQTGKQTMSVLPTALQDIITENISNNPIVRSYVTQLETANAPTFGVPIVNHECVQNIIAVQSARDPTRHQQVPGLQETGHTMEEGMNYHLRPANLSTFTDMDCMQESTNNFKTDQKYYAGDSILRSTRVTTRIEVDANGVDNEPTTSGAPRLTVENATCPFMFPNGIGWCDGKFMSMLQYIQLRMCQLFSAFTLCHAYVMILFQIYQVSTLLNNLSEARLESALHQYYKQHPNSKPIDAMRDVTKRTVPSKLVGSPSYHRRALQDLLAMVHDYGLPSFFLTLTSDEISESRWTEYDHLEDFLERFLHPSSWTQAPIECARLFHDRVTGFMENFILDDKNRVLGRVQHYVLRYESQHRGSLHAHILLWVHHDDIDSVAMEITAALPGPYLPSLENETEFVRFAVAPGGIEDQICSLVKRKQMHKCDHTINGCRARGKPCKYMFPFAPNLNGTVFEPKHGRYIYLRINEDDAYVVPYHPIILLLWQAHMNIQRITATQWSFYILKYTTKIEPHGSLHCDERACQALGLYGLSTHEQQLISAAILTKPVAPCEAALIMSGIPIISSDVKVFYVDTKPPAYREVYNVAGSSFTRQSISDVSKYLGRPKCLRLEGCNVSFKQYFMNYEVRTIGSKSAPRNSIFVDIDEFGQKVYKLQNPKCVRFTNYHPIHNTQAFFYNLLIMHEPFESEEDIAPTNGCYFMACCKRNIVLTPSCLERVIQKFCDYNLYEETQLDGLVQSVSTNLANIHHLSLTQSSQGLDEHLPSVDPYTTLSNIQDIVNMQETLHIELNKTILPIPTIPPDLSVLSNEQLAPVRVIQEFLENRQLSPEPHVEPKLVVISGGPGTGKTFTANVLINHCVAAGFNVYTCATTGAAALRITAVSNMGSPTTVHSAMNLPTKGPLRPLQQNLLNQVDNKRDVRDNLVKSDLILCDEMSMLTNTLLQMMLHRTRMTTLANRKPKILVLVGDRSQLPPICIHCGKHAMDDKEELGDYSSDDDENENIANISISHVDKVEAENPICELCHIMYSSTMREAIQFDFTHVFRQSGDLPYLKFLNKVRVQKPTEKELQRVLKNCFRLYVTRRDVKQDLTVDSTFICTHYRDVLAYNDLMLNWMSANHSTVVTKVHKVGIDHNLTLDEQIELWRWFKSRR